MTTITIKSTKAELFTAYTAVCADAQAQRHAIKELKDDLFMAKSCPALPQGKALHTAYYTYIASRRLEARSANIRVVSYMTFNDWVADQAFGEHIDINAAPRLAAKPVYMAELPKALL